jgi:hypothetical protein
MNYTVIWEPPAENNLADAWIVAQDRTAITHAASHRLDLALASDPYAIGFATGSSVNRTAIDLPLGIDYEIIEDDKKVRVLRVWSVL